MSKSFDSYDIWMVREEYVPFAKRGAYVRALEQKLAGQERRCWPCYVIEGLDAPKFIFLYPMKSYGSLDSYFEKGEGSREGALINYTINTLFHRMHSCEYIPDEAHRNWESTPFLYYWVLSLKYDGLDDFTNHLSELAEKLKGEKSSLCFRSWRVTLGADLPKCVIVLFSKTREDLERDKDVLEVITHKSRQVIRSSYEGKGRLR